MSTDPITTAGRIFVAQMIRDIRARSAAGAGLLLPALSRGARHSKLSHTACTSAAAVHAGDQFAAGRAHLIEAQRKHRACYINLCINRKRSGTFQLLTHEVSKHPATEQGYDGIMLRAYFCRLQRIGRISVAESKVAFVSWHALGRLYERSGANMEDAWNIVGMLGITGLAAGRAPGKPSR